MVRSTLQLTEVVAAIAGTDKRADAIPKKRGPKTDVLEALLKRVNGLEKRLKDEKKPDSPEDIAIDDDIVPADGTIDPALGNGHAAIETQQIQATAVAQQQAVQVQHLSLIHI